MMGPEILGQLVDRHARALVLYARQWCAAPDDVVQEAFIKLAGQKPAPGHPVAWLYRVVRNAAMSAARAERRRRRHESAAAGIAAPWFHDERDGLLDSHTVTEALRALPAEQREIITL